MAYTGLLDGLSVKIGCAADWSGGSEYASVVHELEFETTDHGIGGGSFWLEVADAFDTSAYTTLRHGARVNISHTYDSGTSYLYKGFIISDPRRAIAAGKTRLTIELGGPAEVARWRTDLSFCFTDCDTQEWWIINKRNNRVFNCQTGDCIEISVDKGDEVPSNARAGIIGYNVYLGCGHMAGPGDNQLDAIMRIDGQVTTRLGDHMRAALLVANQYTDERNVTDSVYTNIKTWSVNLTQAHFNSANFWSPTGWGKRYLAAALYCQNVAGDRFKMTGDRRVRLDNVRVYTSSLAKRIDEGLEAVADWVGLHQVAVTGTIYSVVPNLVARPYIDPVSAMNQFAVQAEALVEWGWWPTRTINRIEFRAKKMLTGETAIRDSGRCYITDVEGKAVEWDVRPHPEDGEGDVRAVRLLYGKIGRQSDFPGGTPASVIGPSDPGFSNTRGPFQGATAAVQTVDFTSRNYSTEIARRVAKNLGRMMTNAQTATGTVVSRELVLERESDSAVFPWAYIQGGDFLECSEDSGTKPLLVTSSHVDVEKGEVSLKVGLPAGTLVRQLEDAGNIKRAKLRRR